MAIIPNDEKVFMVSNTTNTTYSGSQALKDMNEWYTMEDVKNTVLPYKVYTALLTQSGGSDEITISSGPVVEGVTYIFNHTKPPEPWDFSNVGGPVYPDKNDFVATSSGVPNEYGTANLTYNTGAPVVTVLENTIGGIVWTYIGPGEYQGTLFGEFPINKTFVIIGGPFSGGNNGYCFAGYYNTNGVVVYSASGPNKILDAGNNILEFTPIEIRVYN